MVRPRIVVAEGAIGLNKPNRHFNFLASLTASRLLYLHKSGRYQREAHWLKFMSTRPNTLSACVLKYTISSDWPLSRGIGSVQAWHFEEVVAVCGGDAQL